MAAFVRTHDIFIAHGWENSEHIHKLVENLDRADAFDEEFTYINHGNFDRSVINDEKLNAEVLALKEQLSQADLVLAMTDLYSEFQEWMDKEVELAKEQEMPVIVIRSYENRQTPPLLEEKADEVVLFDPEHILKGIKKYS